MLKQNHSFFIIKTLILVALSNKYNKQKLKLTEHDLILGLYIRDRIVSGIILAGADHGLVQSAELSQIVVGTAGGRCIVSNAATTIASQLGLLFFQLFLISSYLINNIQACKSSYKIDKAE